MVFILENYFVWGLIFGLVVQPILDGFTSLILSFFEMVKSYLALKITANNQKMQQTSTTSTHVIGFATGEEVEEEYDI